MAASIKLSRLLVAMGYGARREVDGLVYSGRVLMHGAEIDDADMRVEPTTDFAAGITVDGAPLDPVPGMVVMLHKPVGVTCSHKEQGALVYDLLPSRWKRRDPQISTVGRLDKETSGLLLLTDDGAFLHKVISPKHHVPKQYLATLDRPLQGHEAALFARGNLMLEGEEKPLLPAELEVLSSTSARLTLHEGRYHQVRRMFAAAGNHVVALHRESVGMLALPNDLAPGQFRILTTADIALIFAAD